MVRPTMGRCLIHELSVVVVILNGARLAQNGQSFKLLKETMKSMVQDTRIAFASFKASTFLPVDEANLSV